MNPRYRIVALPEVGLTLRRFVQLDSEPERGGLLLGELYPDKHEVHLSIATEPGPMDRGTACTWLRDEATSNKVIREAWTDSGGITNYVGEWHTHPADHPVPSWRDRRTMGKLASSSGLVTDFLLLVIVGRKSVWSGLWSKEYVGPVSISWEGAESEWPTHFECEQNSFRS